MYDEKYIKTKFNTIVKLAKYEYFNYDLATLDKDIVNNIIYGFKTKYKEGFTNLEIIDLLERFPTIKMDKFDDAMMCNSCMVVDEEIIYYHCDLYHAIICGLQNRNLNRFEFD